MTDGGKKTRLGLVGSFGLFARRFVFLELPNFVMQALELGLDCSPLVYRDPVRARAKLAEPVSSAKCRDQTGDQKAGNEEYKHRDNPKS